MTDFTIVSENLRNRGYSVKCFSSGLEAADYVVSSVRNAAVGIGGSATVKTLDLFEKLKCANTVIWHWEQEAASARINAMQTDVYICSANALAETGEIVNIDGAGNRVASTLFGHKKLYLLIGRNKIEKDYDTAVWRARNIAAPRRAKQLGAKTPCAENADRCYDCCCPGRICRGLVTLWGPTMSTETEILLIDEDLGL